ncbi:lipopolysaccharide assembly LapA domain-containing protein [Chitinimonas sp.]|uniref:LapA family protein n=1 Tax=Chitinimonas sp. TaxID=1934313 RepID=UPI0035B3486E
MRYLAWFVKIAVFLLLFAFTLKNTAPVHLYGLLDSHWEAPLIVYLLVFFTAGVLLGMLAMLLPLLRTRRDLAQARKQIKQPQAASTPSLTPDRVEPAQPLDAVV